eukprot:5296540-Pyramimonas_sp.AAC.1
MATTRRPTTGRPQSNRLLPGVGEDQWPDQTVMGQGGAMGGTTLRHSGGTALCARFSHAEDPGSTDAS